MKYNQTRSFNLGLAEELGIETALIYDELAFWSDKGSRTDGWIYKSYNELMDRLPIKLSTMRRSIDKLVEAGYIEKSVMQADHIPTMHFRILKSLGVVNAKTNKPDMSSQDKPELSSQDKSLYTATNNKQHKKLSKDNLKQASGKSENDKPIKKPNRFEIDSVIDYWHNTTRLKPKSKDRQKTRNAVSTLLKRHGLDGTYQLIDIVAFAHTDKYATAKASASTLIELMYNDDSVAIYAKKKLNENNNRRKGIIHVGRK